LIKLAFLAAIWALILARFAFAVSTSFCWSWLSISAIRSPFLTSSPSATASVSICPETRAPTLTNCLASIVPEASTVSSTVARVTAAVVGGAALSLWAE